MPVCNSREAGKQNNSMKTVIKFDVLVSDMLDANGNDLDAVINACQSDANAFKGQETGAKRGDMKGGQSYKADGTLIVKPLVFSETTKTDYTQQPESGKAIKMSPPGELVKWHDSLCRHWKQTGRPSGKLPVDMLPTHLAFWLATKCRKTTGPKPPTAEPVKNGKSGKRNGDVAKVLPVEAPKA